MVEVLLCSMLRPDLGLYEVLFKESEGLRPKTLALLENVTRAAVCRQLPAMCELAVLVSMGLGRLEACTAGWACCLTSSRLGWDGIRAMFGFACEGIKGSMPA